MTKELEKDLLVTAYAEAIGTLRRVMKDGKRRQQLDAAAVLLNHMLDAAHVVIPAQED